MPRQTHTPPLTCFQHSSIKAPTETLNSAAQFCSVGMILCGSSLVWLATTHTHTRLHSRSGSCSPTHSLSLSHSRRSAHAQLRSTQSRAARRSSSVHSVHQSPSRSSHTHSSRVQIRSANGVSTNTHARALPFTLCYREPCVCVCVCTFRLAAVVIVYSVCLLLLSSNVKGTTYMRACVCARTFVTLSTHSASP